MNFFEILRSLFPKSPYFNANYDGSFKKFLKSLSRVPEFVVGEVQKVFLDIFPDTTRELEKWRRIFGVEFIDSLTDSEQRLVLKTLWKLEKGQGVDNLQGLLRLAFPLITIVENTPLRSPKNIGMQYLAVCGNRANICGRKTACCGSYVGMGKMPDIIRNNITQEYSIPENQDWWSVCFFVCKQAQRDPSTNIINRVEWLQVNKKWKSFLEYIVLKSKPAFSTALMFVEYVD